MQVQQTVPLLQHFEGCRHAEGEKTANGLLGESSGRQPTAPTEAGLTLPAGSLLSVGLNLKRGRPSLQQCRDLRTGGSTRTRTPRGGAGGSGQASPARCGDPRPPDLPPATPSGRTRTPAAVPRRPPPGCPAAPAVSPPPGPCPRRRRP